MLKDKVLTAVTSVFTSHKNKFAPAEVRNLSPGTEGISKTIPKIDLKTKRGARQVITAVENNESAIVEHAKAMDAAPATSYTQFRREYLTMKKEDAPSYFELCQKILKLRKHDLNAYHNFLEKNIRPKSEKVHKMGTLLADILLKCSLAGFTRNKPFGYDGAPFILEMVMHRQAFPGSPFYSLNKRLQGMAAPEAVRRRTGMAVKWLEEQDALSRKGTVERRVLVIASGVCSVERFLRKHPGTKLKFDIVHGDQNAINYIEQKLLRLEDVPKIKKAGFVASNTIRLLLAHPCKFSPPEGTLYSAGFTQGAPDYFEDAIILAGIAALAPYFKQGAKFVIGNFSKKDPSKQIMDKFMGWKLNRRSFDDMKRIAELSGYEASVYELKIGGQPVDLFLHLKKN